MNTKLMKYMGSFILGSYGIISIINIIQIKHFPVGDPAYGEYSIFSSADFFSVYNIWGFILAIVALYGMWKEVRVLFLVGLFLLGVQMFYPYFTTNTIQPSQSKQPATGQVDKDSVPVNPSGAPVDAPPMDQLMPDSPQPDSGS